MKLSQQLAQLDTAGSSDEAEERHRAVIRRQLEKLEGKLVRVSGWRDFRAPTERTAVPK